MNTETAEFIFGLVVMACLVLLIAILDNRKKKRDKAMTELRVAEANQRLEAERLRQETENLERQEAETAEREKNRQAITQAKELCQEKGINIFDYLAATDQTALIGFLTADDFVRDWHSKCTLDVWNRTGLIPVGVCQSFNDYTRVLEVCGWWEFFTPQAQRDAVDSAPTPAKKWKLNHNLVPVSPLASAGKYDPHELANALTPEVISEIQNQTTLYGLNDTLKETEGIISELRRWKYGRYDSSYECRNIEAAIRRKLIELAETCASDDPEELLELLDKVSDEVKIDDDCDAAKKIQLHNNVIAKIMIIDPYGYAEKLSGFDYVRQWFANQLAACTASEQVEELQNRLPEKGADFAEMINRRLVEIKLTQS